MSSDWRGSLICEWTKDERVIEWREGMFGCRGGGGDL